ncbi:MAG: metallopeptidase family protein [Burkholderiales bacterium]|nr:metallopeptidase family protein [Phycisphaerae bacterium]
MTKDQFARLVEEALADLPEKFAAFLEEVPIEIHTRPTRKQLRDVGLTDDELLLGLYIGTSLADRSVQHGYEMPNKIFLFQEDIELVSDSPADLKREVRTTVLHEIGHHFGLDEDDLDELGYG